MSNIKISDQEALDYHQFPRPGKISVEPTKPMQTQKDLGLAYTPGVAVPCLEIEKDPDNAYKYTAKSNLVAVISNGTAVLGLGDIGALASKPVMEGKGILFKKFSKLDSFDIEVDSKDIDRFCDVVEAISPTFGGINLEDIKAPECFEIERRLVERLDIPVMHDDQHGTAVISAAGIINACKITSRDIEDLKIVVVGAGAAAISCARLYRHLGVKTIYMIDSKGVVHSKRDDINEYKKEFMCEQVMTQDEVFEGADIVVGLSRPGTFTTEHIKKMAKDPIVFTLANPVPEIFPDDVRAARADAIIATGRSDLPNQVNNVLGFPFIFRGAMDVRAKKINIDMKLAASYALAELTCKEVPEYLNEIYDTKLLFGREYIIPKPFDKRLIVEVSSAVAEAAIKSGSSALKEFDLEAYKRELSSRV
ncbi:malic enzyme-like NAD(P)-binding protein [Sulfurimonas sp. HSL3-2]|uniref:malic enzyme-like NAD(P)-binding protein n=1 Tax=Hydrocurvibacter mobilis TaxID=3131936 RepID=UPI0031F79C8C